MLENTGQKTNQKQTLQKLKTTKKANNAKHSKTKLLWF